MAGICDFLQDIELAEEQLCCDDTVWLITWNPSDKFKKTCSVGEYDKQWEDMVCKVLRHLNRCCNYYCIVPEISVAGRLHCHGWFVLKDKIKWHKSVLPTIQRNGLYKIDKMNQKFEKRDKTFYYYKKDLPDTYRILSDCYALTNLNCKTRIDYYKDQIAKRAITLKGFAPVYDITKYFCDEYTSDN